MIVNKFYLLILIGLAFCLISLSDGQENPVDSGSSTSVSSTSVSSSSSASSNNSNLDNQTKNKNNNDKNNDNNNDNSNRIIYEDILLDEYENGYGGHKESEQSQAVVYPWYRTLFEQEAQIEELVAKVRNMVIADYIDMFFNSFPSLKFLQNRDDGGYE